MADNDNSAADVEFLVTNKVRDMEDVRALFEPSADSNGTQIRASFSRGTVSFLIWKVKVKKQPETNNHLSCVSPIHSANRYAIAPVATLSRVRYALFFGIIGLVCARIAFRSQGQQLQD